MSYDKQYFFFTCCAMGVEAISVGGIVLLLIFLKTTKFLWALRVLDKGIVANTTDEI